MLDFSISQSEGIMILEPQAPLSKVDFDGVSRAADSYLADHDKLRGVLIRSKDFPGWEDFAGFSAHMHFVHDHHKKIDRVAIVTDSHFGGIAESLGAHFTSAEIKQFPFADDMKALAWLQTAIR
jgi:hypothetical protein